MIHGIGVDMASISRIKKVHDRFGERFARRILNDAELLTYRARTNQAIFLTKRFAVKEAAAKALGTGEREGVLLKDFSITHDELGKPLLEVTGQAEKILNIQGIKHRYVSLSDEKDSVVAFVILER